MGCLAFRKLGREEKASQIFEKLIDFGKQRLQAATSMDFFAKFGESQSAMYRQANAHYLLGLGYLGREDKEQARVQFKKSLELNINHLWAKLQLAWLDKDIEK
jgi:tetratricopeptide (TPR) repeat protein